MGGSLAGWPLAGWPLSPHPNPTLTHPPTRTLSLPLSSTPTLKLSIALTETPASSSTLSRTLNLTVQTFYYQVSILMASDEQLRERPRTRTHAQSRAFTFTCPQQRPKLTPDLHLAISRCQSSSHITKRTIHPTCLGAKSSAEIRTERHHKHPHPHPHSHSLLGRF